MRKRRWYEVYALILLASLLAGCSAKAPYMRGWDGVAGHNQRWTGGSLKESKLSDDEATVYTELGTPDTIRFFRALQTRQRVYQWLYEEPDQAVWFVDGQRVDYVAVDTNTSGRTKEARETTQRKLVTGGVLGTVIGGFTTGFLLFGDSLDLKD